jgi:hypothetical protein
MAPTCSTFVFLSTEARRRAILSRSRRRASTLATLQPILAPPLRSPLCSRCCASSNGRASPRLMAPSDPSTHRQGQATAWNSAELTGRPIPSSFDSQHAANPALLMMLHILKSSRQEATLDLTCIHKQVFTSKPRNSPLHLTSLNDSAPNLGSTCCSCSCSSRTLRA